jgi:hypothetical protein
MLLSASEARPGPDVQNVNGWTMFFLLVAWDSRDQRKPGTERSFLPQLASGARSGIAITRPTAAMVIRSVAGSPRMPVYGTGTTARAAVHSGGCGAGSRGLNGAQCSESSGSLSRGEA